MLLKRLVVLTAVVGAIFVAVTVNPAKADSGGTTTVSQVVYSQASFNATDTDSSVALLVLHEKDKVQLRWQSPSSAKLRGACPTINNWSQRRGLKCFTAGNGLKGKQFANSGVNPVTGQRVYFTDYIGSKYSPVGTVFYWDPVARAWRKRKCKNYVRFNRLPQLSMEQVHLTRYASFMATATATATAQVMGTATASCSSSDGQVWASATVQAWGTASATATIKVQGHDSTKVLAQARDQSLSIVSNQQISLSGSAQAKADAGVSGNATVFCSGTPPPPPPQAPSCSNVTTPENGPGGVYADGETYPGTVGVFGPNGNSLTVYFGAPLGSGWFTSPATFTSNGVDNLNWVYQAPSDESSVGQYDQITITVHDNTTGLTGSCESGLFVINEPPGGRP